MANYTALDVKALREKSGAGMMDCKGALDEADGDIEKAFEVLRLKGLKGVSKREGRTTSNGLVVSRITSGSAVIIELACETDFVAKAENFVTLADQVADAISAAGATTIEAALEAPLGNSTVSASITDKAAIMGEKVELRKVEVISAPGLDAYMHRTSRDLPPQVGVVLGFEGADADTAHDIAVQSQLLAQPTFHVKTCLPRLLLRSAKLLRRLLATRASPRRLWQRSSMDE